MILAIDPGLSESGWVMYHRHKCKYPLYHFGISDNEAVIDKIRFCQRSLIVVIEDFSSFGLPIGADCKLTIRYTGRLDQAVRQCLGDLAIFIERRTVKQVLCNSMTAKDANIRQALIDRFGPGKEKAIGTKKAPGPLYGVKRDVWSALALAVTYVELQKAGEQ